VTGGKFYTAIAAVELISKLSDILLSVTGTGASITSLTMGE
jgi:hypothetical protein